MAYVIVAVVALMVGFYFGRHRLYKLQNESEEYVRKVLKSAFYSSSYHLMNNVTLPVGDGTTQVDHILVSRFGIFVIETKNYKGWIFANPNSKEWTQVLFKEKHRFQNPIRQNYKHLKTVRGILDFLPSEIIHPAVVFTGEAEFRTPRPEGVFDIEGLVRYIESFSDEVISENRLQFSVGRLEYLRMSLTYETDVEHRMNLQRKYGSLD